MASDHVGYTVAYMQWFSECELLRSILTASSILMLLLMWCSRLPNPIAEDHWRLQLPESLWIVDKQVQRHYARASTSPPEGYLKGFYNLDILMAGIFLFT